jgi:hypothetical protein
MSGGDGGSWSRTNFFEIFLDPDSTVALPHVSVFQLPTKAKLFAFSISTENTKPHRGVAVF